MGVEVEPPQSASCGAAHRAVLGFGSDRSFNRLIAEVAGYRRPFVERLGQLVYKNGGRDGADAYLLLSLNDGLVVAVAANRFVKDFEGSTGDVAEQILGWLRR